MSTRHWSRDVVVSEIKKLSEDDCDLRHSEVTEHHQKLVSAAVRYFGSWGAAVTAAGIDYTGIRRKSQDIRSAKVTKWSLDSIAEGIKRLIDSGECLAAATVRTNHPALFSAAVSPRYYGSWRNALTVQGLDYDSILTQNRVSSTAPRDARGMRTVVRRLRVLGKSVQPLPGNMAHAKYPKLYERAVAHFGSWEAALEEAFGSRLN